MHAQSVLNDPHSSTKTQFKCSKGIDDGIRDARSFIADGLKVGGSILMRKELKASGEIRLLGAKIGNNLECDGAQIESPNKKALSADGIFVNGSVYLRYGFKAYGEVRLLGAQIEGSLECDNAQFINQGDHALSADELEVKGGVFLRKGFKADGGVRLIVGKIGNLDCEGGTFLNSNADAINAERLNIVNSAYFRKGSVVSGRLNFKGATIGKHFCILDMKDSKDYQLDLSASKVGILWDDAGSWPEPGKLHLNGFIYEDIDQAAPTESSTRCEWLRRQPQEKFLPQPYEQLSNVLRAMGHEDDAVNILYEKNLKKAKQVKLFKRGWLWYKYFGRTIGYGYRPWRAFWLSIAMIVIGCVIFKVAYNDHLFETTRAEYKLKETNIPDNYPVFSPIVYSIETFVPLLDFRVAEYFIPNANAGEEIQLFLMKMKSGALLRAYTWVHKILGWILTTLWIAGFSGVIRR